MRRYGHPHGTGNDRVPVQLCNHFTGRIITDRRAGRIHDTNALSTAIQDGVDLENFGVEFTFRSGAGHRASLALKGEGLGYWCLFQ